MRISTMAGLVVGMSMPLAAQATTYVVNDLNDSCGGASTSQLRGALMAAEADPLAPHIVEIDSNFAPSITLDYCPLPHVTRDITVRVVGPSGVTIETRDGGFFFAQGSFGRPDVVMEGPLTIIGALSTGGPAPGLEAQDIRSLSIQDVTFMEFEGTSVFVSDVDDVDLSDVAFTANEGSATLLIDQCIDVQLTDLDLVGTDNSGFSSGLFGPDQYALRVRADTVDLTKVRILDGIELSGAAIEAVGQVDILSSEFLRNQGVGLYVESDGMNLVNSRLSQNDNTSSSMPVSGAAAGATFQGVNATVRSSDFTWNQNNDLGGGFMAMAESVQIENSTFAENLAIGEGAGVVLFGLTSPATLTHCTFNANQSAGVGATALAGDSAGVSLLANLFQNGAGINCGAVSGGSFTLTGTDNVTDDDTCVPKIGNRTLSIQGLNPLTVGGHATAGWIGTAYAPLDVLGPAHGYGANSGVCRLPVDQLGTARVAGPSSCDAGAHED